MNQKITLNERKDIVNLFREGVSINELANQYEVTYQAISIILRNAGAKKVKPTIKRPSEDTLYELYILENMKQKDIATRYSVSAGAVCAWLKDAGISKEWKDLKISEEDKRKYEQGEYTQGQIAEIYGVSNRQIKYVLAKNGSRKRAFPKRRHDYKVKRLQEKRSQGGGNG